MFLLWMLIICSLSTAEVKGEDANANNGQLKQIESQGKEAGNLEEHQQLCMQDINAVLREMSSSLAGLKVEVRYLQRDNEAQTKKAKELEQQYLAQSAKVKDLELKNSELEQQNQAQAAKMKELELQKTELNKMKQDYQVHTKELLTIKTRANITENEVEALKRDGEVKQVAFSASLMASGGRDIGPFNAYTTLIFRHVVLNTGSAYNLNTGFFTAPVKGVYHFAFHLYGHGHDAHGTGAVLVKNGEHIYNAYEHQNSHGANSANSVTLLLDVGDVVFLLQRTNTRIFDDDFHYTTFSGHLLFTQ